jgi:signal transduction histidine kinase
VDLVKVNTIKDNGLFNGQLLDTQMGFIYDIAVPISSQKSLLGQARIGILQNSIQKTINAINAIFVVITLLTMLTGIVLAYRISSLITKPISRLVEAAQSIQRGNFSTKIDIKTKDEIGVLAFAFNKMAVCLKEKIQEIKRLSTIEERNRIAFDLHDGCAQDMANIIKRLELCQRLFKINPKQALEELNILKQNTREVLGKTREVIFDLKSFQDGEFNLAHRITDYIKHYNSQNGINVRLDIAGLANDIPRNKSKEVFYIIKEALNNIKKHSQAKNVELSMGIDNKHNLDIYIRDDGQGFNINDTAIYKSTYEKLGLISMRKRTINLGGAITIKSQPGKGTQIFVNIPLEDEQYISQNLS